MRVVFKTLRIICIGGSGIERMIVMRFPIIKVRDKDSGRTHIVGTNPHDTLVHNKDTGSLEYYNLQNGCGTPATYEFMAGDYVPMLGCPVEFITAQELLELIKPNGK